MPYCIECTGLWNPYLFQCADHVGYETVAPVTTAMVIPVVIDKEERIFRLAQDTMAHRERRHWRKIDDLDRPKQFTGAAHISLGPCGPNAPKLVDQCVQVIGHFQLLLTDCIIRSPKKCDVDIYSICRRDRAG